MKRIFPLVIYLLVVTGAIAQANEKVADKFYMLDANFNGTTQQNALYFIRVAKLNDHSWQFDTYNINGPMISTERYKDEKGQVLHGQCVYFNKKGTRDSIINFTDGLPDGSWYYLNDTGKIFLEKKYAAGRLTATIDRIRQDSLDAIEYKKRDTVKTIEEESSFPGGIKGWGKYLNENMVYPDRAQKLEKQGTVIIQFIVDTEGKVTDPEIIQSVEFSIDDEALRMLYKSPKWKAAFQNGKKVKSYKRQPLTFKLTRP